MGWIETFQNRDVASEYLRSCLPLGYIQTASPRLAETAINQLARRVAAIVVDAFDGEAYLLWERSST